VMCLIYWIQSSKILYKNEIRDY